MPTLDIFQIDAFADAVFGGNPAAVCPLTEWLPDGLMQAIAAENNLSETAFFVAAEDGYDLRWFTPSLEVELCGHATLATAFLILTRLTPEADAVRFETRSGRLDVVRDGDRFFLDFPAYPGDAVACPPALSDGLGVEPHTVIAGPNYMAVLETEDAVAGLQPDMPVLEKLHPRGVIATAPGEDCDFVSRFFGPSFGVPEDPVTGSAHCMLIPYWARRLGKSSLDARQISARGGRLACEDRGDRVGIGGAAVMYLEGRITV
ncbi:MAG: PhzF family phenazine biosynthesis protein [Alphaproteobacteria bacterium]